MLSQIPAIQAARAGRAYGSPSLALAEPMRPASQVSDVRFDEFIADAVADAAETLRQGEAASIRGLRGEASVQEVVRAVMAAETTLQTVVAVRDKVVQAYQDLLRMQL